MSSPVSSPVSEQELDISYAGAFLKEWLKDAPEQVKINLNTVIDGVKLYRDKYFTEAEDFAGLQARYNELTGLTAGYLQLIQQQRQLLDEVLIEQQRDLHKKGPEEEEKYIL